MMAVDPESREVTPCDLRKTGHDLNPPVKPMRRVMAEPTDVAELAEASATKVELPDRFPMRDETGDIRSEFVEEISRAIKAEEAGVLRAVVAELHEADLGDLIGALASDDRVRLVELTGTDFDFSALNEVDETVREEILEELEPETVAEGVRELESDDAVEILESLDEKEQEEILARNATCSSAASTIPKIPPDGGCRPNSSRCRLAGRWGRRSTTCA
jgi:flagellar motility protein MotE (MotC chaperone)